LLTGGLLAACSRARNPVERVAVLPFENLSGDPALEWIAAAGPKILADQLLGDATSGSVPTLAPALRDAYAASATRLVHGYFDKRRQSLHFEFAVEDSQTHKTLQTITGDGAVLPVLDRLAKALDAGAHPFSSANPDAVAAWGRGQYENAVMLDPDFGTAWLSWAQSRSAAGDPQQAVDIIGRALAQSSLRSPIDRAELELLSATLRRDEPARQLALAGLAKFVPNDTALLRQLASQAMNARQFSQAAQFYQNILRIEPEDIESWNMLGYAQAFAGDLDSARKSFEEYGRDPARTANALDSEGEVFFSRGKFAEAEKYFLQANDKNSAMLSGGDLLKAAYSHWLQGDLPGADRIFAQYITLRTQQKDPLVVWRQAVWEYSTGRPDAAIARLASVTGTGAGADAARTQLAVWRDSSKLPTDPAALKQLYDRTPPTSDGLTRVLYAAALVQAGRKDDARKLLELWPLPGGENDPLLQSLLFPKYLELKRQLN
jgi:tetratricopeptide (TPR) repeat protein